MSDACSKSRRWHPSNEWESALLQTVLLAQKLLQVESVGLLQRVLLAQKLLQVGSVGLLQRVLLVQKLLQVGPVELLLVGLVQAEDTGVVRRAHQVGEVRKVHEVQEGKGSVLD